MNTREFKLGDRIKVLSTSDWYEDLSIETGTIVCRGLGKGDYGIKFDEPIPYGKGHDLDGFLSKNEEDYGYYINKKDLIPLKGGNSNAY